MWHNKGNYRKLIQPDAVMAKRYLKIAREEVKFHEVLGLVKFN